MIQGFSTALFSANTAGLLMAQGCVIPEGSIATTAYLSDMQLQHLGRRPFTDNPLIKTFTSVADRNVIATQTGPVCVDELVRQVLEELGEGVSAMLLGDLTDTPTKQEKELFEKIRERYQLPIDIFVRGNHSSNNAFGVVNLQSRHYRRFRSLRDINLQAQFSLRHEIQQVAGGKENVLSDEGTIESMHESVHGHRAAKTPGIKAINVPITEANYDGYLPRGATETIPFDAAHRSQNFEMFWKAAPEPNDGLCSAKPLWECLVNGHLADQEEVQRKSKVTPFYIQATEQARFQLKDGSEVPVYTISLDGLDNNFLLPAFNSELSELQIRAVETFMDHMLAQNPRARFKFTSHFSSQNLLSPPWFRRWRGRHARKALRKLLSREEVVLYTYGHTHERGVTDLNKALKLKRKTPLMQVNVPSLMDYHPVKDEAPKDEAYPYRDARALMIEKMYITRDEKGEAELKIDLRFRGLNWDDLLKAGLTPEAKDALEAYRSKHSYLRSQETMAISRRQHVRGWMHSHWLRAGEAIMGSLKMFLGGKYWKEVSILKYIIDNFTVVSTVKQFSEAYHLIPFMDSLSALIRQDGDPEDLAVKTQIDSLRNVLAEEWRVRKYEFDMAMMHGERPSELREYNDLFERAGTHQLSHLLLQLKPGGQARAFAVLAGIQASREEWEFNKGKPTEVPNELPSIAIPLELSLAAQGETQT